MLRLATMLVIEINCPFQTANVRSFLYFPYFRFGLIVNSLGLSPIILRGSGQTWNYWAIIARNSSSDRIVTPSFWAFSSLDGPMFAPARR